MYTRYISNICLARREEGGEGRRTRVAISRSKGFEIRERKKKGKGKRKRKSCCPVLAWDIFHGRWFITRARAFHALVESAFTTRCAKFFNCCPRLAPWKLISRVQGPAAKSPICSPLSLSLSPSLRLVFLIKCKYANRMEKRVLICPRSLIVKLYILTERERENNFEFFFPNWI